MLNVIVSFAPYWIAAIIIIVIAIAISYSFHNMFDMPTFAESGAGVDIAFNNSNPYRIGSFVYVMEADGISNMDWYGMVTGISNGMVMVRDNDSNVVANVNKDQVFGVDR